MLFENKTNEMIAVRFESKPMQYNWKWIMPNNTIELDEITGQAYGLTSVSKKPVVAEVKPIKKVVKKK